MEPEYSWQAVKSSGPGYHRDPAMKRYGWWVTLAVVLAGLFHVALFLIFGKIEVRQWGAVYEEVVQLAQEREKIVIDEETLSRIMEEEEPVPTPRDRPPEEIPTEDLPAELPEVTESVRLTPAVSEPQNLFASAPAPKFPAEANLSAVKDSMSFDLAETAGEDVKSELLEASKQASTEQPKIYIEESEVQVGLEADELVEEMTNSLGSADAAKIRGRFDSLDELLGSGKAMPDNAEILIPTDLLFEFGSAEVREEAKLSLMKLGMLILANPDSTYLFKGYTDTIPFRRREGREGPSNNEELSIARAEAVRDWLVGSLDLKGFDLRIQGFGSADPLVEPSSRATSQRVKEEAINRRVEVEIIESVGEQATAKERRSGRRQIRGLSGTIPSASPGPCRGPSSPARETGAFVRERTVRLRCRDPVSEDAGARPSRSAHRAETENPVNPWSPVGRRGVERRFARRGQNLIQIFSRLRDKSSSRVRFRGVSGNGHVR